MTEAPDPFVGLLALPGVFEAVEGARASVDALLREPVVRRRRREVTVEALRRGAWASAALEGAVLPLDAFRPPFGEDETGLVAAGALRATTELAGLADVWRRAPLQALARLHALAASRLVGGDALGRPASPEAARRLTTLAELLSGPTQAAAVVVAAVVHGELAAWRPFGSADGLVARAASRLVLIERGLDPSAVSIPEVGLLEVGASAYAQAIEGYRDGGEEGLTDWLVRFAEGVARGAVAGRQVCAELSAGRG